ncbi:MAG: hypothetical protein HY299_09835 [Verrucomicrobia bacterium]|nr:hypothetical protein [Verrucomicrobiota bacterium]
MPSKWASDLFDIATPIARKYVVGEDDSPDPNDESGFQADKKKFNRLNGSGPVDQNAADRAPTSFWQFLTGARSGTPSADGQNGSGGYTFSVLLVVGVGVVIWLLWRRR